MKVGAYNPVIVLIRLAGLIAALAVCYAMFRVVQNSLNEIRWHPPMWLPLTVLLLAVAAMGGLAAFAATAARFPTRTHLAALVAIGAIVLGIHLKLWAERGLELIITSAALPGVQHAVSWMIFLTVLFVALAVEWRLAKAGRFTPADARWWQSSNIRGLCVFLAWVTFLFTPWLDSDSEWLRDVIRPEYLDPDYPVIWLFLLKVAFCIAIGKLLPAVLIRLTGLPPDPKAEPRKKRGLHPADAVAEPAARGHPRGSW